MPVRSTPTPPAVRPLGPGDYPVNASQFIVIDFEGYRGKPPVFAGVWEDGHFRVVILDERFKALVKLGHPFVKYQSIKTFLHRMYRRALVHNKYLVGYSEHEANVFAEYYGDISEVYLNARKPLGRWFTLNDRENRPRPFGLKELMKYFRYNAYQEYPLKGVTRVLTQVFRQLKNHNGDIERLTPLAASRWKELLDYNKQDVLGLMYVMKRAKILAF
ncbi:MAG: hypothetical protein FJX86_04135 [Bacteroidetes bacterium]|nr:hypothetical protein [Bacteroidota bacterium]